MVDISLIGDRVRVHVRGWSRLWALTSALEFDVSSIRHVRADPTVAHGVWKGIRLPGTHIPGVIIAGRFRQQGKWNFWDVRSGERAIVIDLEGERYDSIIVEVEDPGETVRLLQGAMTTRQTAHPQ